MEEVRHLMTQLAPHYDSTASRLHTTSPCVCASFNILHHSKKSSETTWVETVLHIDLDISRIMEESPRILRSDGMDKMIQLLIHAIIIRDAIPCNWSFTPYLALKDGEGLLNGIIIW